MNYMTKLSCEIILPNYLTIKRYVWDVYSKKLINYRCKFENFVSRIQGLKSSCTVVEWRYIACFVNIKIQSDRFLAIKWFLFDPK